MSLITAFNSAYIMAADLCSNVEFFNWELKQQILPNLKNWAVEYELQRRSEAEIIPFECKVVDNARRNCKHIELVGRNLLITVSQVHRPLDVPRHSVFRNNHSMDGQMVMSEIISENESDIGSVYAILTHGWNSSVPSFVCCGVPEANMRAWAQIINLHDKVKGMKASDPAPVTKKIELHFRESVKEKSSNK